MRVDEATYQAMPENIKAMFRKLPNHGSEEVLELFPVAKSAYPGRQDLADAYAGSEVPLNGVTSFGGQRAGLSRSDSGSAARFFKSCQFTEEELCESANIAVENLNQPSNQEDSVPRDVPISEALGDAPSTMESTHIPAYTGSSDGCSQRQNLALFAEGQESIGTTPTTENHSKSSGYASHAIGAKIRSGASAGPGNISLDGRRLIYTPKASRAEREMGCEGTEEVDRPYMQTANGTSGKSSMPDKTVARGCNHHPTVKPLALMRYLCRLVTPPNGLVLDNFMGSGTTGMAAKLEGFRFTGIDKEPEYVAIAERRIAAA